MQEKKCICYYHLIKKESNIKVRGPGDCSICIPDIENKYCKNYIKVNISILNVKEANKCLK